jgi:hypothetical protein
MNKGRVIKWLGDAPTDPEAYVKPEAHPQCVEIVEFADGEPTRVTFKREESSNGTD